jgi:hypothetical protein
MKTLIISLLLFFTVNAQDGVTRFFVDRDSPAGTEGDGTSWANAWNGFHSNNGFPGCDIDGGIDWSVISSGDTIYVSGGSDSTVYTTYTSGGQIYIFPPGTVDGEGEDNPVYVSFAQQVVVCPSWESGHNGDVYIAEFGTVQGYLMRIKGIENVKFTNFHFRHRFVNSVATGLIVDGSKIVIDSCTFRGNGFNPIGILLSGQGSTLQNSLLEQPYNNHYNEQDLVTIGSGIGGATIDRNVIIYRNGSEPKVMSNDAGIVYTGTSLYDPRLNLDSMQAVMGGARVISGEDTSSLTITSSTSNTVTGSGGWFGDGTPSNGEGYTIFGDAHKDMFQGSNFGDLDVDVTVNVVFSNNFFIDTRTEGDGWNAGIYLSGAYVKYNCFIYNNIIVSRKTGITSFTPIWAGTPGVNEWINNDLVYKSSMFILNNTIIIKGAHDSRLFSTYNFDTLVVKNNLCIVDTTLDILWGQTLYNPDDSMNFFIDYNGYFEQGGISADFSEGAGFGNYDWSDWITELTNNGYLDNNSITGNSENVTFTNKYDTLITGYYTTTGRDAGIDLSADYPFLATDILGNPRTGTWDIGALEYPTIQHNRWVGLGHSVMRRYFDYEGEISADSSAPSMREEVYRQFNSQYSWGADSIFADWRYFPETPYGTDWINWLYCFRGEIDDTSDNWLASLINEFDVIVVKGGIQTCDMTDLYGSSADTSGAGVTKKSVYNYKWIWREMLEFMEAQPDKFFVLMPGSGSGDYKALGSQVGIVAQEFATWAEDTLQAGLDPIYGAFPENVYVFNQYKYLTDAEGWLKDEYESRTPDEDDHPNATAMRLVVPLYVQEIGNAVLAWEGSQIPETPVDSLPNTFTFTDITNATRSTLYTSNGVTLAGFDSAYAYASGNVYTINGGSDLTGYTKVFPNDVLRLKLTSSGSYSTGVSSTLNVGGRTDTYTVTTEAEPYVPPSGNGGPLKGSNGRIIFDSTGKRIITR